MEVPTYPPQPTLTDRICAALPRGSARCYLTVYVRENRGWKRPWLTVVLSGSLGEVAIPFVPLARRRAELFDVATDEWLTEES